MDIDIIAKVNKKPHRKIQKFHKTNWDKMKEETQEIKQSSMDQYQNRSPDENYKKLKSHLNNITEKYVPSKMSRSHFSPPWYNSRVKRMCNKKQRLNALTNRNIGMLIIHTRRTLLKQYANHIVHTYIHT